MTKVREAVHLLQLALPGFQMNTEEHTAVVGAIGKLSKLVPAQDQQAQQGVSNTNLMALLQKAKQSAMMQQLASGGAGGGGPGGPPPSPQAGAGGPPPGM